MEVLRVEVLAVPEHAPDRVEEPAHDGDERHLLLLAAGEQGFIGGLDVWTTLDGDQCRHEERETQVPVAGAADMSRNQHDREIKGTSHASRRMQTNSVRHSKPEAITLLELICAVSVVAIVGLLAFAAFRGAQAASKRTQCISNLRQVNSAVLLYAVDHDGALPASSELPADQEREIWVRYRELVLSYLDTSSGSTLASAQTFRCPVDHVEAPERPSYYFNGGNEYDESFPGLAGRRLASIQHPARTILVAEAAASLPYSWHEPEPSGGLYTNARNVVSFCDGHVAFVPIYWDGVHLAATVDPPAEYGYQWSP